MEIKITIEPGFFYIEEDYDSIKCPDFELLHPKLQKAIIKSLQNKCEDYDN